MSSWNTNSGDAFVAQNAPGLWTPTRQSFAARLTENARFLRAVKCDFVRGRSDAQVEQERDGGFALHVVGSTPTGSDGAYRALADRDDYGGMLPSGGFTNRYITVCGSAIFLDHPANALPGGSSEGLLKSNLLGSEGGSVKPIFGAWYTGGGVARPVDGSSTRVFQKTGTYNDGEHYYELAFFAGAAGSDDEGRLMLYERAPHGVAFQLLFWCSPRCEFDAA